MSDYFTKSKGDSKQYFVEAGTSTRPRPLKNCGKSLQPTDAKGEVTRSIGSYGTQRYGLVVNRYKIK